MSALSSPVLKRVVNGDLCSGCGLCAGVAPGAIELETVHPGYTRPRQLAPITAATEEKIASACPGSTVAPWREGRGDMYWGPYQEVLTGYAADPTIRHSGSSGGALSAIAIHALAEGHVDAVLHIEADSAQPTRNVIKISRSAEDVLSGAGSRYAASSPLATIDAVLDSGLRHAFIGKPCDISALRQLALHDRRVDQFIPLKLSFFCGGLPSHDGADRIVQAMGLEPEALVQFRYRGMGWPGKTIAKMKDGRIGEMSYAESWGGHLSKEVQFRCKICPDAVGGVADIAAADAWYGGESGYPQFEEQDGRSLIMARTTVGTELIARCREARVIVAEPLPIREIDLMQPAQANRKRLVRSRLAACRTLAQPTPSMAGLMVREASRQARWRLKLRNYIGTVRRIVQGRR